MNTNMIKLDRNLPETSAYPVKGHDMTEFIKRAYKRQLAVDKFPEFWKVYIDTIQESTQFETLQGRSLGTEKKGVLKINLRDLLNCTLTPSTTQMLFGTKLLEIEPNMPKHIHGFIDGLWKLVYRYPRWAIPDLA
ncbi:hypothetical protein CC80DRAFT_141213 [Byssothecium circinans]|uniref:Uncharacterized protein n=1 Tax=Byssothecium circinans TaxID=147558 RepID=A0A6A5TPD5_9PLEO|nr:hypothetical protein CC80DRAFT_141213 [Byssothecium circinans]